MNKSVYCIAQDSLQAEMIVNDLKAAGFLSNSISVLFPDKSTTNDFAHEKNTKAPEGTAIGGTVGMGTGAILGWLAGIGSLAIPGVGPFIAAGPIVGALSGGAVGAAVGGIAGALIGMGIPEFEAKRYEGKIQGGSALISVHTIDGDQVDMVKDIYKRHNAEDIASSKEDSAK